MERSLSLAVTAGRDARPMVKSKSGLGEFRPKESEHSA
jgi:hypothetical protein